jgi:hypothetical protein
MLQWEKRQQAKIWEVDEKTGAALLGRAGWWKNDTGWWVSPDGASINTIAAALKSIGLELKE